MLHQWRSPVRRPSSPPPIQTTTTYLRHRRQFRLHQVENRSKTSHSFSTATGQSPPTLTFARSPSPQSQDLQSVDCWGLQSSETGVASSTVEALDEIKVLDLEGNEVPITDLWKDRKSVLAFPCHFGCVFFRKRADYLATKKARAFSEQTKFKGEVYTDPDQSSYAALKFVSGASTTFTPKAGSKIIQLYMEGYRQDWELTFQRETVEKGGWQQGGILVAGPGKSNISYVYKDKEAGDEPPIEDVLKACCA